MNIDWFQPFQHTQTFGRRYLYDHFQPAQKTPGPNEPKKNINSFLRPIVKELQQLWGGVMFKTVQGTSVLVRAALLCVACDIPAARKTCRFLGHSALYGCSKCLNLFPTANFGEKPDYSNFCQASWGVRDPIKHREEAIKHKNCNTRAEQKFIERNYGVCYSVLVDLPYFDAPRMCFIDPMHHLLLGTAKHFIETWKTLHIISDFNVIQQRVDSFITPGDIGRTPSKISSSFSGFIAEQFKNWTIYFSLFALKSVLPWRHYNCWLLFVKICYILCRRTITDALLKEADDLILNFSNSFMELYILW